MVRGVYLLLLLLLLLLFFYDLEFKNKYSSFFVEVAKQFLFYITIGYKKVSVYR